MRGGEQRPYSPNTRQVLSEMQAPGRAVRLKAPGTGAGTNWWVWVTGSRCSRVCYGRNPPERWVRGWQMMASVVGILSPGDMGAGIGRVLRGHGVDVITCLAGRSDLTRLRAGGGRHARGGEPG